MEIYIAQPVGFTELGLRTNNEDALFPPNPSEVPTSQRWFLVCDGVGGAEKGEVASALAVHSFDLFFQKNPAQVATEEYIQQAVSYAEDQLNEYLNENPQADGMATTVTLVCLHEEGATVAHIGDSRVYFIRNGQIKWRTDDHSYVNELIKAGTLTPAEARRHPKQNIITRALQAGKKQAQASVQVINDLQKGDYFFLCSDGVLERIGDELIEHTLAGSESNAEKMETLRRLSIGGNTRDNFTAYLIQIDHVIGSMESINWAPLPVFEHSVNEDDGSITVMPNSGSLVDLDESIPNQSKIDLPLSATKDKLGSAPLLISKPGSGSVYILWALAGIFLSIGVYFSWITFLNHRSISVATHSTRQNSSAQNTRRQSNKTELSRSPVTSATRSVPSTGRASAQKNSSEKIPLLIVLGDPVSGIYVGKDQDGLFGLTRDKKNWWINPQFRNIRSIKAHYFRCEKVSGIKQFIVNNNGKPLVLDEIGKMHCNYMLVRKGERYDYLNENYQLVGEFRFSKAEDYNKNKACTAEVVQAGEVRRVDVSFQNSKSNNPQTKQNVQ